MESKSSDDEVRQRMVLKRLFSAVEESSCVGLDSSESHLALVKLFQPSRGNDFIEKGLSSHQQQALLLDSLRSASKPHIKRFFSSVKSILDTVVSEESYVPASAFAEEDDKDFVVTSDKKSTSSLHFLKWVALLADTVVQEFVEQGNELPGRQLSMPAQVYDVVIDLHDILLSVSDCGPESPPTLNAILSLCERWWVSNVIHRDTVIAQVLPLLVLKASDTAELQKSHIKKLYKFKDAFLAIDFSNPSSSSLKSLLLRVASNPLCLKMIEGKKFLAALFRDPDLVPDLHLAFRAQIPQGSKTIMKSYSEIYHKAWQYTLEEGEEAQQVMEEQALQDFMFSAIHLAQPSMLASILAILEPLHADKKDPQVARMLHRLYSPIVWRSLQAANPVVRKNAVVILEKVFPLHDPEQGQMKSSLSKCCLALESALKDSDVKVRAAASIATANVCSIFWDALPSADIRMLLNHIFVEHCSDVKASAVRVAAVDAATTLLDVPQSHAVLRPLLPSLGNLIHDKAEKVRLATVRLLRRVKSISGIRYYHVVPVDHLTSRFSEEARLHNNPRNPVAKELAALMVNSYFPQGDNVSASDQIQRTVSFLLSNQEAAIGFYANLSDLLPLESVCKFITMLLACLESSIRSDESEQVKRASVSKKRQRGRHKESEESMESTDEDAGANMQLMSGLAQLISVLLDSVQSELNLDDNAQTLASLKKRFSSANVHGILGYFERQAADRSSSSEDVRNDSLLAARAHAALLLAFSCLPEASIEGLADYVEASLSRVVGSEVEGSDLIAHFLMLASWGKVDKVASSLANSIESAFVDNLGVQLLSPCFVSESGLRRSRRSKSSTNGNAFEIPALPAELALSVVDEILAAQNAPSLALRNIVLGDEKAAASLLSALRKGIAFAEQYLGQQVAFGESFKETDVAVILLCCETFGRLVLHMSVVNGRFEDEIKELVQWTSSKVIPIFSRGCTMDNLDLSRISSVSESGDGLSQMSPPRQRVNLNATPNGKAVPISRNEASGRTSQVSSMTFAKALLNSSCAILAECLYTGTDCASIIATHTSAWCSIFNEDSSGAGRVNKELDDLIPSFLRLGVQLCKVASEYSLLKGMLRGCKANLDASVLFKKALQTLLHPSSHDKDVNSVVDTVLSVAYELVEAVDVSLSELNEDSFVSMWSDMGYPCVSSAVELLLTQDRTVRYLVSSILADLGNGEILISAPKTFIQAKCLSELKAFLPSDPITDSILQRLENQDMPEPDPRQMLERLVDAAV
eukprot:Nitzschia sp. Nitz4//scaffold54_size114964//89139//93060//NITZ4_003863-RA/size114964-processed-gene-0.168-mRNA-1//1//CDS//3329554387//259//frame0